MLRTAAFLTAVLALCAPAARGAAAPASPAAPPASPAAPAAAGETPVIKTLPGIVVDTKAKEVRLEGMVCLQKGPLELLVCSPGTREHESVIVVRARPSHVTFALALLGLAPGKPGYTTEGGGFSPPAGVVLDITARFTVTKGDGASKKTETVEVPAWKLLRPSGSSEGLERPLQWVYVGQPGQEALRAADSEGTVVCLSNFAEAVIDVPFESTAVNADLMYEANPDIVPPPKTPVELIIRPTGERIEPKKVEIEIVLRKGKPPLLDGKPIEVTALKDTLNAMPVDIRTAVLKAEPDEAFGRVMQVHDLLVDALMRVRLVVLQPQAAATGGGPAAPPLAILVVADDKIQVAGQTLTLQEFRAKAEQLLKGVAQAALTVRKEASYKTVAEVMTIARECNVDVALTRGAPLAEGPAKN
jgi:biopolymer transport protein ExbD